MKTPRSFMAGLLQTAALLLCGISALAQPAPSNNPVRVAFLGDSISMDGRWVILVESALRANPAYASAEIVNFALSSETASGLSEPGHAGGAFPRPCVHERLGRVLAAFKPTLVLACYGMNDGIYLPLDPARFKAYRDGMTRLKADVEKSGARFIAITPPLYMADAPARDGQHYDAVLDACAGWLIGQQAHGWQVIDIRPALKKAVAAAHKADPQFVYARDTVHPGDEGHGMIAAAVWPGLAELLNLPATPKFAQGKALEILTQREHLLQNAWMTDTGHLRPGCPGYRKPGEPLPKTSAVADSAASADQLLLQYQKQ